jgi:very-short-patch-repair endonuclease
LRVRAETAAAICARLASRQKGVVARRQLLAAGVSRRMIDHLIRCGFLHPIHRGVYAVGHLALPQYAHEQAALLACGDGSVITGGSGLYVWGILDARPSDVEVTVAGRHCRKRDGIRLHLTNDLDERDVRRRHGLRVVFPALALIEYAADATDDELGDAVATARIKGRIRDGELERALERFGRRRGAARMRAFLEDEGGPSITRSRAERRFRKLIRQAGLPQPRTNVRLGSYEPDFLWVDEKVIVEVDSWKFHGHRRAFETDRKKDMVLRDAGYLVIRITWRQFTQETLWLIAHLARALDRRSRTRG